jgi:hypothetical protein
MKVGDGLGVGGMAVAVDVIVGGAVRVGKGGAAKVGRGNEAALVVASQADNMMTNKQHKKMMCRPLADRALAVE